MGFPFPDMVKILTDALGKIAKSAFDIVLNALTKWLTEGVMWLVRGVFNFFVDTADPNVQSDWFVGGNGPYATTMMFGATLLVGFVLAGIVQGVFTGDVSGMLRRMIVDVPVAILEMVGLVVVTQLLIRATDAMSGALLKHFLSDSKEFIAAVSRITFFATAGVGAPLVVFVLCAVLLLAGLVVIAELFIRSALIYIVVALAPLAFAAQVWPALKGTGRKLLDLLAALIISKLVIAVALAVAVAAAVGTGSGGEVTSLTPPEVAAEDPGGSVTQAVGILLTACAAFGVAAFSPMIVVKLLPLAEGAAGAMQGVKGGPMRAAQQAMSMGFYGKQLKGGSRAGELASGDAPGADSAGLASGGGAAGVADGGAAAGGAASGGAAAGGAAAGGAAGLGVLAAAALAKDAINKGAEAGIQTATDAADRPTSQNWAPPDGSSPSGDTSARPADMPANGWTPPGAAGNGDPGSGPAPQRSSAWAPPDGSAPMEHHSVAPDSTTPANDASAAWTSPDASAPPVAGAG